MKKVIALFLAIIMIFSLCSCGVKKPLNATNFMNLADSDGYLYAVGGDFDTSVLWFDSSSNKVKAEGLKDDFSFDQNRLMDSEDWLFTATDEQHFTFEKDWAVKLNLYNPWCFTLLYSDPDGQYVIFVDEDEKSHSSNFWGYQVTFGNKQLMSSVVNKYTQNRMYDQLDTLSLEQWISFVDSCK